MAHSSVFCICWLISLPPGTYSFLPQPALTDPSPVSLYPGALSHHLDPHYAFFPLKWDVCDLSLTNEYRIAFVLDGWFLFCVNSSYLGNWIVLRTERQHDSNVFVLLTLPGLRLSIDWGSPCQMSGRLDAVGRTKDFELKDFWLWDHCHQGKAFLKEIQKS